MAKKTAQEVEEELNRMKLKEMKGAGLVLMIKSALVLILLGAMYMAMRSIA